MSLLSQSGPGVGFSPVVASPASDEDTMHEEALAYTLRRIPGLFRRWELAELLKPGEDYHLEDAGHADDGTPLLAVYRGSILDEELGR